MRLFVALALVAAASCAHAAVFTVNATGDPGSGGCDLAECTLREAIAAANAAAGADTIAFGIAGAGPHTITVTTQLPNINGALTIDGYTQAGSAPNTLTPADGGSDAILTIAIVGACASCDGLSINNSAFLLRGVAIGGFGGRILNAFGAGAGTTQADLRIEGSFIGLQADGDTMIMPLGLYGFRSIRPATVGGTLPAQRNVIAGYSAFGISVSNTATLIQGNLVGLDATGTVDRSGANSSALQLISPAIVAGQAIVVGGSSTNERNVLASASGTAVSVTCASQPLCFDGGRVSGNFIQLDAFGGALPAQVLRNGVSFRAPPGGQFTIGGSLAGERNRIGMPGQFGVIVLPYDEAATTFGSVALLGNRFVGIGAGELPIRLATSNAVDTAPLANDAGDADAGPNQLQNTPIVTAVSWDQVSTTIAYRIDSAPAASSYPLRVEMLQRRGASMTGAQAVDSYALGDAQQVRSVTFAVTAGTILPFQVIATDASGRSSELDPVLYGDVVFAGGFED